MFPQPEQVRLGGNCPRSMTTPLANQVRCLEPFPSILSSKESAPPRTLPSNTRHRRTEAMTMPSMHRPQGDRPGQSLAVLLGSALVGPWGCANLHPANILPQIVRVIRWYIRGAEQVDHLVLNKRPSAKHRLCIDAGFNDRRSAVRAEQQGSGYLRLQWPDGSSISRPARQRCQPGSAPGQAKSAPGHGRLLRRPCGPIIEPRKRGYFVQNKSCPRFQTGRSLVNADCFNPAYKQESTTVQGPMRAAASLPLAAARRYLLRRKPAAGHGRSTRASTGWPSFRFASFVCHTRRSRPTAEQLAEACFCAIRA